MFCFKSIIIFFCLLNFNFLFSSDNLLNSGFFDFNLSEKTDIKNGNIAIINGSVADLYVQSPEKVDLEVLKMYSSSNNRLIYRSAQAIYGEIVIVENEDENKKYVKIFHPFHFYIDSSGKMNNCFYIKSEKLNKLDDAIKNKYLEAFNSKKKAILKKKISRDFIDFYPGTTFFYSGKEHKGISVCLYFDNKINDFKKTLIPSKYLIKRASIFYDKNYILNNDLKLRTSIIEILKSFLDKRDKDMIPYVFGGTSIGRYFNEDDLIKKELMINGKKKNFYAPIKDETPIIGPDCSGLVGLISRMVGVPMVFRNSSVQEMFLSEVENEILDGDILWINGHVIILNPSENRCIECAGYESGFKGLRENEISERIKDISNFKNLMKANNEKRAISLINTNGEIKEKKIWKLLSLTSCLKFDFFIDSIFFNYAQ